MFLVLLLIYYFFSFIFSSIHDIIYLEQYHLFTYRLIMKKTKKKTLRLAIAHETFLYVVLRNNFHVK